MILIEMIRKVLMITQKAWLINKTQNLCAVCSKPQLKDKVTMVRLLWQLYNKTNQLRKRTQFMKVKNVWLRNKKYLLHWKKTIWTMFMGNLLKCPVAKNWISSCKCTKLLMENCRTNCSGLSLIIKKNLTRLIEKPIHSNTELFFDQTHLNQSIVQIDNT